MKKYIIALIVLAVMIAMPICNASDWYDLKSRTGRSLEWEECWDCGGSGDCPTCDGSGTCQECNGEDEDCLFCSGSGFCSDCNGSGSCNSCNGFGGEWR